MTSTPGDRPDPAHAPGPERSLGPDIPPDDAATDHGTGDHGTGDGIVDGPVVDHAARGTLRQAREYPKDLVGELDALDTNVYAAVAASPTPTLDNALRNLTRAADGGVLWFVVAALLATVGGRRGRAAAIDGLVSLGVTSAVANLVVKPALRRQRPDRELHGVILARQVPLPSSTSFPSGHTASAFAFATGASRELPLLGAPLHILATTVGWSRVHTGVHYPGDVVVGGLIGASIGTVVGGMARRIQQRRGPGRAVALEHPSRTPPVE